MEWPGFLVVLCCLISNSVGQNKDAVTCPPFIEVYPCQCNVVQEGVSLECQNIARISEMSPVFQKNFLNETVYEFILSNSPMMSLTTSGFGTTSFRRIIIKDSFLVHMEAAAFETSYLTLTYFELNTLILDARSPLFTYMNNFLYLETLHINRIDSCFIPAFPIVKSDSLKEFRLLHHEVPSIDDGSYLQNMPNLEKVSISWTGATALFFAFYSTPGITFLSLMGNNLKSVDISTFEFLDKAEHLDLSFNKLASSGITAGTFEIFAKLQHLDLSHNVFVDLPSEELKSLPQLQFLNASCNRLSSLVSGTFSGNLNLSTVDLDSNNLQVLNENSFSGMVEQAATIYLRSSNIFNISDSAFGGTSNSQIHLENNALPALEESWLRPLLEKDNNVYVDGNPFKCDCDFSWILDDPKFVSLLSGKCEDGTPFENLDETYFTEC